MYALTVWDKLTLHAVDKLLCDNNDNCWFTRLQIIACVRSLPVTTPSFVSSQPLVIRCLDRLVADRTLLRRCSAEDYGRYRYTFNCLGSNITRNLRLSVRAINFEQISNSIHEIITTMYNTARNSTTLPLNGVATVYNQRLAERTKQMSTGDF